MATRKIDGKHWTLCVCKKRTYRSDGLCTRCANGGTFAADKLSEEQLMACATELLRRHKLREETLKKIGMLMLASTELTEGRAA